MTRKSLIAAPLAVLLACSRGDTSAMANMPGMTDTLPPSRSDSALAVTLSSVQVRHGGIRWQPATANSSAGDPVPSRGSGAAVPGQLAPDEDRTARLGAPARGRVLTVRVSPGDRIAAGQILVTLESPDAAAAQSDLSKAAAGVTAKRAQASYASSARKRAERLLALKAIPRQEYERAIADDELAQAELTQAEAELRRTRTTASALGASDGPDGDLVLRAPRGGVVLERLALPGTVVEAGTPLVVVTDPSVLWLTMDVPETLIGGLRVGAGLGFTVPAYPADTFTARVTAVGAGLDPDKRTLPVRATVANSSGRLKSAMLAAVQVPLGAGVGGARGSIPGDSGWVVLPADAVQLLRGLATVFVVMPDGKGGGHFMARPVEVGARTAGRATITGGVRSGELVVIEGAFAVKAAIEKGKMPDMEM
jgi:cobalt-zinc-cadmium efflux system membrane fusion protein